MCWYLSLALLSYCCSVPVKSSQTTFPKWSLLVTAPVSQGCLQPAEVLITEFFFVNSRYHVFLPGLLYKLSTPSAFMYVSITLVEIRLSASSFALCQITFPSIIFVTPSCKVSPSSHCLKTGKLLSFFHLQRISCLQNSILIRLHSGP